MRGIQTRAGLHLTGSVGQILRENELQVQPVSWVVPSPRFSSRSGAGPSSSTVPHFASFTDPWDSASSLLDGLQFAEAVWKVRCSGLNTGPPLRSEHPGGTRALTSFRRNGKARASGARLPRLTADAVCCRCADSWCDYKSLRKFTVSPNLPHPVFKQVIFEPEGISTHLVIRNKIHSPHQGPKQPGSAYVSFPATLLTSLTPAPLVSSSCNSQDRSLLGNLEAGTSLARKALPTFTDSHMAPHDAGPAKTVNPKPLKSPLHLSTLHSILLHSSCCSW